MAAPAEFDPGIDDQDAAPGDDGCELLTSAHGHVALVASDQQRPAGVLKAGAVHLGELLAGTVDQVQVFLVGEAALMLADTGEQAVRYREVLQVLLTH